MAKLQKINCPLCNYEKSEIMFYLGNRIFPLNIALCKKCGFVFQNPRFSVEEWDNYYKNDYDDFHRPIESKRQNNKANFDTARIIYERLSYNIKLANIKSMMDVGAGNGNILKYFRNRLVSMQSLMAVEPSEQYFNNLQQANIQLLIKDISQFDPNDSKKPDLIILRHVLEHIYDPIRFMKKVVSLMHSHSIIYVAVPNLHDFNDNLLHCFGFPHISYFNQNTLGLFAAHIGLEAIAMNKGNHELYMIGRKSRSVPKDCAKGNYNLTKNNMRDNYNQLEYCQKLFKRYVSYVLPRNMLKQWITAKRNPNDRF